jgi:signal peptidase I
MSITIGKHRRAHQSSGPRLIAAQLARVVLGVAAIVMLWTIVALPFGWSSVVVSSGSMMPRLHVGDVVVSQPTTARKAEIGKFILVENPAQPGALLLHRLVRRNADGTLITKGDANASEDSSPVPTTLVRGLPRLSIRYVGLPVVWLRTGSYLPLGVTAVVLIVLFMVGFPHGHRPSHRRSPHGPMPGRLHRGARAGLAVLLISVLAGTLVPSAHAKYGALTATGSNSWTSGTVTFGANSPAGALFADAGAIPGTIDSKCVVVSYTGSLTSQVHEYVPTLTLTGALGTNLIVQIRSGTGASSTCSDFAATTTDYNTTGLSDTTKTLSALSTASYDYASGVGSWSATTGTTRTYQVSWILLPADNAAAGGTASFSLVWEARG